MGAAHKVKDDLNTLQHDVRRVLHDLSKLSSHLKVASQEVVEEGSKQVSSTLEHQLEELRTTLSSLSDALKDYGKLANESIRKHPLAYTAGAVSLGFLVGKLLLERYRSDE